MNSRRAACPRLAGLLVLCAVLAYPLPANELRQSAAAAFGGNMGLESVYDGGTGTSFLRKRVNFSERRVVTNFWIRPDMDMSQAEKVQQVILEARDQATGEPSLRVYLRRNSVRPDRLQISARAMWNEGRSWRYARAVPVRARTWTRITIDWKRSDPGAANGHLEIEYQQLGRDTMSRDPETGLPNEGPGIDEIRFGQVSRPDVRHLGKIYFDNFTWRRDR